MTIPPWRVVDIDNVIESEQRWHLKTILLILFNICLFCIKIMKNIIIAFPPDLIKKYYDNLDNVFFYDGVSIFNKRITPFFVNDSFDGAPQGLSISDIRKSLSFWSPIIERWCGNLNQYKLIRDEIVFNVCALASVIKKYEIKNVIFHTGVPHHIDSLTLSIACEVVSVKQIFLYPNVIDNSIIPLLQLGDISTRVIPRHIKIQNKNQEVVLKDFLDNVFQRKKLYGGNEIKKINTIFFFLIFALIRQKLKNFLRIWLYAFLGLFSKNTRPLPKDYSDYSFLSYVKMLYAQKRFIEIYKKKSANTRIAEINKVKLIIFSSMQPEASSFPEGLYSSSFIDMCLALRSKGYKEKILYKEHKANFEFYNPIVGISRAGLYRNPEYINLIQALGCEFISADYPSSISSAKNYLPVTISGTIALERSLLGLRTLVFGSPWFSEMPGIIKFSEIESLVEIDKKWTETDIVLADLSKQWILKVLEDHKLINATGVGIGSKSSVFDKESKVFFKQLDSLLKQL